MLSIRYRIFWMALAAPILCGQNLAAPSFGCPASIPVTEAPAASAPWQAETARAEHKFLRPSIYNGAPGKEEYDLAPDNTQTEGKRVKQTWKISDYRDRNVFLRCRYENTAAAVVANIPARIKTCTFSFRNVPGNQPVASPVFSCQ